MPTSPPQAWSNPPIDRLSVLAERLNRWAIRCLKMSTDIHTKTNSLFGLQGCGNTGSPDQTDLFVLNFVVVDHKFKLDLSSMSLTLFLSHFVQYDIMFFSQGVTMEGSIPKRTMHIFDNKVNKGTINRIAASQIFRAREKYKTVDHPWRITFAQKTIVEPVVPQPRDFPKYGYTLILYHGSEIALG